MWGTLRLSKICANLCAERHSRVGGNAAELWHCY